MNTAFVGFSSTTIPEWQNFLLEPHAPSNYKDKDKIVEYIEAARDKQAAEANKLPLTSIIEEVVIFGGNSAFEAKPITIDLKAYSLATYLNNYHRIAAINASDLLRLARYDHIARHQYLGEDTMWLAFPDINSRFGKPFVFDPISRLIGSDAKDQSDPWLVAKRFLKCDERQYSQRYTGVKGRAVLTIELARILGC